MDTSYLPEALGVDSAGNITLSIPQSVTDSSIGVKWPLLPLKISLAVFGLICNTFIFIGLAERSKRMRTLEILLLNLAIWDTAFLSSRICQQTMQALLTNCTNRAACSGLYFAHQIFNYTAKTCFITSMLATISVAMERYLYSFMPIKVTSYSNRRRTKLLVVAVVGLSLVVSIPEALIVACVYHVYVQQSLRMLGDPVWPVCRPAIFNYAVKSGVLLRLTVKILAWVTLLVLDLVLIRRLLLGARRARRMYDEDRGQVYHPRSFNERSVTVAVMTLVLMSLVAYPVTGLVWVLTYESAGWNSLLDPRLIPDIQEAGKVVQLIYASSNLFFLLLFGTRFRRNLLNRLCSCIVRCCRGTQFQ